MDNSNYVWKDFTKDDLKAWILANTDIQDWNHCHNIELNEEQLNSLCSAIGCESISPINIWIYFSDTVSPEQWWIGTDDDSEITLIFSDIYGKVKGESLSNNLKRAKTRGIDGNSEEGNTLVLRNIRSVSAGMDLKDTYKLTPNQITFLDYIEMTNTSASGSTSTSGSKLYTKSYLTALGKYHIDNKQFKIISYPTGGPPVWGTEEGYQFSSAQNYGGGSSSKRYKDWTINNSSPDVVVESFSADSSEISTLSIESVSDNSFTYQKNGFNYTGKKNSWQDVYIIKRTSNNIGTVSWDDPPVPHHWRTTYDPEAWFASTSAYGFRQFPGSSWTLQPFARCGPGWKGTNPYCEIKDCTTKVEYKCNTENNWHDISTDNKIKNLFTDTSFTMEFKCPAHRKGGYVSWSYAFAQNINDIPNSLYTNGTWYIYVSNCFAADFYTTSDYTYHVKISGQYKRFNTIGETLINEEAFEPNVSCASGNVYNTGGNTWITNGAAFIRANFVITHCNRGIFSERTIFNDSLESTDELDSRCEMIWYLNMGSSGNIYTRWQASLYGIFTTGIRMRVSTETDIKTAYAIVLIDRRE